MTTLAIVAAMSVLVVAPSSAADRQGADVSTQTSCGLLWLTATGQNTQLDGAGTLVVRPGPGTFTIRCQVTIPDDPSLASFDTVCGAVGDDCVNGVVIIVPRDGFLFCRTGRGDSSDDAFAVATTSGQYMFVCDGELASP